MAPATVTEKMQFAAGWAFPWVEAQYRPKPLLEEARALQSTQRLNATVGTQYRLRCASLWESTSPLLKRIRGHQQKPSIAVQNQHGGGNLTSRRVDLRPECSVQPILDITLL